MHPNVMKCTLPLVLFTATTIFAADYAKQVTTGTRGGASLWSEPADIASRDLFYGAGGAAHQPRAPYKFVKEDLDGTNPKFVVRDANGVKWKVKLGLESQPETVASRIVWAAGYHVTEDYYLEEMTVAGWPAKVHRGQKLIDPGGVLHEVRLKRAPQGEKLATWRWRDGDFTGTREWNGLRTLMALLNNWDLKDDNNAIYRIGIKRIYMVSDLGATFGSSSRTWPRDKAKGNLESYTQSRFVHKIDDDTVDFQAPARPTWIYMVNPKEYINRIRLESLGKDVPRDDARWMGEWLGKLSLAQVKDAFRAGGYSPEEVDAFARLVMDRIAVLNDL
ncbi:MAG: hypothetical protein ABI759_17065 [Candidatus Solibacter sp.]